MSLSADELRLNEPMDWLGLFSFFTFSVFLTGFFYFFNAVDLYKVFKMAVLLPAVPGMLRGIRVMGRDPLFLLLAAFLSFLLLSSAWSLPFSRSLFFEQTRYVLFILAFFVVGASLAERYPGLFARLLKLLVLVAAASAVVSLLWWYSRHPFPGSRVISIGILKNPNPVGFAYGLVGVLALGLGLRARGRREMQIFLVCALLLFTLVWFTQSRTALAASAIASGLLLLSLGNKKRGLLALAALVGALTLLFLLIPEVAKSISERSITIQARFVVWDEVLAQVATSPWYGHGFLSENMRLVMGQRLHVHNSFLAALRDGGVIALGLLLMTLVYGSWRAFKADEGRSGLLLLSLLVFAIVCMLTDQDRLVTRPRELWIILWLPLLLVMIAPYLNRAARLEGDSDGVHGAGGGSRRDSGGAQSSSG